MPKRVYASAITDQKLRQQLTIMLCRLSDPTLILWEPHVTFTYKKKLPTGVNLLKFPLLVETRELYPTSHSVNLRLWFEGYEHCVNKKGLTKPDIHITLAKFEPEETEDYYAVNETEETVKSICKWLEKRWTPPTYILLNRPVEIGVLNSNFKIIRPKDRHRWIYHWQSMFDSC